MKVLWFILSMVHIVAATKAKQANSFCIGSTILPSRNTAKSPVPSNETVSFVEVYNRRKVPVFVSCVDNNQQEHIRHMLRVNCAGGINVLGCTMLRFRELAGKSDYAQCPASQGSRFTFLPFVNATLASKHINFASNPLTVVVSQIFNGILISKTATLDRFFHSVPLTLLSDADCLEAKQDSYSWNYQLQLSLPRKLDSSDANLAKASLTIEHGHGLVESSPKRKKHSGPDATIRTSVINLLQVQVLPISVPIQTACPVCNYQSREQGLEALQEDLRNSMVEINLTHEASVSPSRLPLEICPKCLGKGTTSQMCTGTHTTQSRNWMDKLNVSNSTTGDGSTSYGVFPAFRPEEDSIHLDTTMHRTCNMCRGTGTVVSPRDFLPLNSRNRSRHTTNHLSSSHSHSCHHCHGKRFAMTQVSIQETIPAGAGFDWMHTRSGEGGIDAYSLPGDITLRLGDNPPGFSLKVAELLCSTNPQVAKDQKKNLEKTLEYIEGIVRNKQGDLSGCVRKDGIALIFPSEWQRTSIHASAQTMAMVETAYQRLLQNRTWTDLHANNEEYAEGRMDINLKLENSLSNLYILMPFLLEQRPPTGKSIYPKPTYVAPPSLLADIYLPPTGAPAGSIIAFVSPHTHTKVHLLNTSNIFPLDDSDVILVPGMGLPLHSTSDPALDWYRPSYLYKHNNVPRAGLDIRTNSCTWNETLPRFPEVVKSCVRANAPAIEQFYPGLEYTPNTVFSFVEAFKGIKIPPGKDKRNRSVSKNRQLPLETSRNPLTLEPLNGGVCLSAELDKIVECVEKSVADRYESVLTKHCRSMPPLWKEHFSQLRRSCKQRHDMSPETASHWKVIGPLASPKDFFLDTMSNLLFNTYEAASRSEPVVDAPESKANGVEFNNALLREKLLEMQMVSSDLPDSRTFLACPPSEYWDDNEWKNTLRSIVQSSLLGNNESDDLQQYLNRQVNYGYPFGFGLLRVHLELEDD